MKKFAGCVIKDNTITLTKAFAKLAYTPGTDEFRHLAELHKAFPEFPIVKRTATSNENKEKHDGLTIARMEWYIVSVEQDEKALGEFENAKKFYKGMSGYYGKMKKWFLDKYKKEYLNADFSKANKPDEEKPAEAPATEETADLRIAG
jgi:hypothetical protein